MTTTTLTLTLTTRYSGPTDTRGSRITAKGAGRQLSVPYDYALGVVDNHAAAAQALAQVLGCTGTVHAVRAPRLVKGYRFEVNA